MQLHGTSHLLHASRRETIQFSQFEILSGFTSVVEFPPTSRIPHTRIMTKQFFQLTMHMFSDPHTFLIAIFGHIQNTTNHFATFPRTSGRGCGGQFSIYVTVYRKSGHNAACVNIEKRSIDFLKMHCFKPMEGNG